MASQYEPQPQSPTATPRRGWWSRPIATVPAHNDRDPTFKEGAALCSPCCGGLLTVIAVFTILNFLDQAHSQAKFSIQSIKISPTPLFSATSTWHVDFLVKNPSSRYSIHYDIDDVRVRLGSLNAAILNISRVRGSRDLTAFSLVFVAEERRNDVVLGQVLDVKIRGQQKLYVECDDVGYFHIRCRNLKNIDKIICQSSFTASYMSV